MDGNLISIHQSLNWSEYIQNKLCVFLDPADRQFWVRVDPRKNALLFRTVAEAWTLADPWRCAVVSGTDALAAHPLRSVSCERGLPGSDLFVQHFTHMLTGLRSGEFRGQVGTLNMLLCSLNIAVDFKLMRTESFEELKYFQIQDKYI